MTNLILFYEFFKIGLFSVGGGLATIPFLYDLADKYNWFTESMLLDMIAVSESTPGPIGVNMATFAGYNASGIFGGIVATVGLITPSVIIIMIVANFLNKFKSSKVVESIFYGLRPAVAALIAAAGYAVFKISILSLEKFNDKGILGIINIKESILLIALLIFISKYKKHPVIYIAVSAIIGIIFKF